MERVKGKKKPISLGSVKLSQFKKIINHLENGPLDDPSLSFEFIINAFFPEVPKNMQKNLENEYNRGFREGYAAATQDTVKLP